MNNPKYQPKLLQIIPTNGYGGAEEYCLTIGSAAKKNNWDVHVAFPKSEGTTQLIKKFSGQGISYHPLAITKAPKKHLGILRSELPSFLRTLLLLQKIDPDIVTITLPFLDRGFASIMACAFLKKPTQVVFQLASKKIQMSIQKIKAYEWARQQNQTWIAVSDQNRHIISETFHCEVDEIELIYNGVKISSDKTRNISSNLARKKLREELNLPLDSRLLLTVGRLHPQKGHIDLIPAIPQLVKQFPDIYFLWAGEGELRQTLEQKAREYEISERIIFLGYRSDIQKIYQASDLFIFPSHFEGQPFSLMEAMSWGLPVVTTSVSGIPEIINDNIHGLLFEAGDSCDLLKKVQFALNNPELLKKMSLEAKKQ
ncbi:MAG: glycosyltransferase family 4 protein, partial [Candidatus Woesearchaeota archaeon]